jgi:hypothetical protein
VRRIGNDLTFTLLPHHLSIARTLSTYGHLPMWDSRGFGGRPMVGNPQAGAFYPPVWPVWFSGMPSAYGWLTVAHLFWGAIGVYVLLRSAGQGRWAATVGAGTYGASPYLLAHVSEGHYPHTWAACWYPWAFWALAELRAGRSRGFLILPLVLALTFLTGHPQEWFLLIISLTSWELLRAIETGRRRGLRAAVVKLVSFLGVLALSLGLSGIDALPQYAVRPWLLRQTQPGLGIELPRRYHLQALNGFQLLSPRALGAPADYFGDDNYWETVLSVGLFALVLALAAVRFHPERFLVRGWVALAGVAVWFACGRHMALYSILFVLIPGISWFRVPARSLFLANLACAVLAGMGVAALETKLRTTDEWRRFAARTAGIMAALLTFLYLVASDSISGWNRASLAASRILHDHLFWFAMIGLLAATLLGCISVRRLGQPLASRLIGLLALIELAVAGFSFLEITPADHFLGFDPVGSTLAGFASNSSQAGPVRIKTRGSSYGDLCAAVRGIEKTDINDLFQLDHAARLYEALFDVQFRPRPRSSSMPMNTAVLNFRRQIRQMVFDRMSVEYLVSEGVEPDPDWPVVAQGFGTGSPYVIQRNPGALPHAYVVPSAFIAPADSGSALSCLREVDPRVSVLVRDDPLLQVPSDPRQPFTPARWICFDPDHPALSVSTTAPGLLVVADTWMPGWTARVDGVPTPVIEGNLAQRVVPLLRPGRHAIVMSYRPPWFLVGCVITAVSGVIWLLVACHLVPFQPWSPWLKRASPAE